MANMRLASSHNPASIFDDLDALRQAQGTSTKPAFRGPRRPRISETFARIPHDRARRLYRLSGAAWALLIELDRLIFEGRGCNPVRLTTKSLKDSGLSEKRKRHGLEELEDAGVIAVERKQGRSPLITHLWFRTSP